jgi:hypothetical protein
MNPLSSQELWRAGVTCALRPWRTDLVSDDPVLQQSGRGEARQSGRLGDI